MKCHPMTYRSLIHTLTLAAAGVALSARADIITDWNQLALSVIQAQNPTPPIASRLLAILHTAIYDAVNGISQTHTPYAVRDKAPGVASKAAAATAAAYQVLSSIFTNETWRAQFTQAYAES